MSIPREVRRQTWSQVWRHVMVDLAWRQKVHHPTVRRSSKQVVFRTSWSGPEVRGWARDGG